jgi:hypothetical protein
LKNELHWLAGCWHVPATPPVHVYVVLGQLALVTHDLGVQVPTWPPLHVDP